MNLFGWWRKSGDSRGGRTGGPGPADAHAAPPGAGRPDTGPSDDGSAVIAPLLPGATSSPDELRRLLFDAVAAGDEARLESLCREHREFILAESAGWLEVPEAFRSSPEAYTWYGNGLRAIAQFCSAKLGDADLPRNVDPPSHETPLRH